MTNEAGKLLYHEHRKDALTCYDHEGYCCICGEHNTPGFVEHFAAVIEVKIKVSELMYWLTENTNEWALEVNPHAGIYASREDYVKHVDEESWHEGLNEGPNLYEIRAYPSTPISQYHFFGTNLVDVLTEMKNCVEPHRAGGKLPMRKEAYSSE